MTAMIGRCGKAVGFISVVIIAAHNLTVAKSAGD